MTDAPGPVPGDFRILIVDFIFAVIGGSVLVAVILVFIAALRGHP